MAFKVPKQKALSKKQKATPPALQTPPQPTQGPPQNEVVNYLISQVTGQNLPKPEITEQVLLAAVALLYFKLEGVSADMKVLDAAIMEGKKMIGSLK